MKKFEKYKRFSGDLDRLFSLLKYRPTIHSKSLNQRLAINTYGQTQDEEINDPFIDVRFDESVHYKFISQLIEDYPTLLSARTMLSINELESKHTSIRKVDMYDRLPLYMIYFNSIEGAKRIYEEIKLEKEIIIENNSIRINHKIINLSDYKIELLETLLEILKDKQDYGFNISYDEINDVMNSGTIVKNKKYKNDFEDIRANFRKMQIDDFFLSVGNKSLVINSEYLIS